MSIAMTLPWPGSRRRTRLRRKKVNQRRTERTATLRGFVRKMMGALVAGILTLGIAFGAVQVIQRADGPFTRLEIGGILQHVDAGQVRDIVSQYSGAGFFAVDVEKIQSALEDLPWVQRADVARVWPSTLRVTIVEHTPLATWGSKDRLISTTGEIFSPPQATVPAGLPHLSGPEQTESIVAEHYHRYQKILSIIGHGIQQLQLDQRRAWVMTMDNNIQVTLGTVYATQRLQRFVHVYGKAFDEFMQRVEAQAIDLRYGNGFAIRPARPQMTDKANRG